MGIKNAPVYCHRNDRFVKIKLKQLHADITGTLFTEGTALFLISEDSDNHFFVTGLKRIVTQ